MAREWNHLSVYAAASRITGSIVKICTGHASADTVITDYTTGTFKSLTYPNGDVASITGSQNIADTTGETDIVATGENGQGCIDGPFIAVHIDGNTTLVYHNGIASSTED